jgi:uncharacterized FAD-dependent dehydrogenase
MMAAETMTRASGIMTQDLRSFRSGGTPVMRRQPTIAASLGSLRDTIPSEILVSLLEGLEQLLRTSPKLVSEETMVVAPAVDHYWNTFRTDDAFMTDVDGLYLVGDAVGRFRGMLQAAWSGIICARQIIASLTDVRPIHSDVILTTAVIPVTQSLTVK